MLGVLSNDYPCLGLSLVVCSVLEKGMDILSWRACSRTHRENGAVGELVFHPHLPLTSGTAGGRNRGRWAGAQGAVQQGGGGA